MKLRTRGSMAALLRPCLRTPSLLRRTTRRRCRRRPRPCAARPPARCRTSRASPPRAPRSSRSSRTWRARLSERPRCSPRSSGSIWSRRGGRVPRYGATTTPSGGAKRCAGRARLPREQARLRRQRKAAGREGNPLRARWCCLGCCARRVSCVCAVPRACRLARGVLVAGAVGRARRGATGLLGYLTVFFGAKRRKIFEGIFTPARARNIF